MKIKKICAILTFIFQIQSDQVDLILFSYSNAKNLKNILKKIQLNYIANLSEVFIFHDCKFVDGENGFYAVKQEFFAEATFVNLGVPPQATIYPVTHRIVTQLDAPYIAFMNDEAIINKKINFSSYFKELNQGKVIYLHNAKTKIILAKKTTILEHLNKLKEMRFEEKIHFPNFNFKSAITITREI